MLHQRVFPLKKTERDAAAQRRAVSSKRKISFFPRNDRAYGLKCGDFKLKMLQGRSGRDCLCLAPGRRVVKSSALRFCVFYLLDFIDIFSSMGGFSRRDVVSTGNVCQTVGIWIKGGAAR